MPRNQDGVAFGSASDRFSQNGLHPNLLATGKMPYNEINSATVLGPGSYDLLRYNEFSDTNVTRKAQGPNWDRALHTEKMARLPHLLYRDAHKKKLEDKRRLGPGYYDFKDNLQMEESKPHSNRGMLDALSARFSYKNLNNNPGPCEYGLPDEKIEERRKNKPGKVPVFERSKGPRSLPMVGCEVPPGTYNLKSSIDSLLNKKVSKRGPYDVFSEVRSFQPKWGHYAQDPEKNLGPGQYKIGSFTDEHSDRYRHKHGKFGKIAQYPNKSGDRISIEHVSLRPRNPSWPGPGAYTPGELSKFESHPPAFLVSAKRNDKRSQKFFMRNYNPVGVGRYVIQKFEESEHKNGHTSLFLSKSKQTTDHKSEVYLKERLKPRNLSHEQKRNLYLSGHVEGQTA